MSVLFFSFFFCDSLSPSIASLFQTRYGYLLPGICVRLGPGVAETERAGCHRDCPKIPVAKFRPTHCGDGPQADTQSRQFTSDSSEASADLIIRLVLPLIFAVAAIGLLPWPARRVCTRVQ